MTAGRLLFGTLMLTLMASAVSLAQDARHTPATCGGRDPNSRLTCETRREPDVKTQRS